METVVLAQVGRFAVDVGTAVGIAAIGIYEEGPAIDVVDPGACGDLRQGRDIDVVGKRARTRPGASTIMRAHPAELRTALPTTSMSRPWRRSPHAPGSILHVDSWSLFINSNGSYAGALPDVNGLTLITVRQDDGLHLSREGTTWLATAVYTMIRRDWQLP